LSFGRRKPRKGLLSGKRPKNKSKVLIEAHWVTVPFEHLLGIRELSADQIVHLLDTAETFRDISKREIKKVPACAAGPSSIFSLNHRRTRTSFEIAAKRYRQTQSTSGLNVKRF
jgi:aspartate carbamoyltransferase catalytic subunit